MSKYMAEALNLAGLALGNTSPNPLVGAVIVNTGETVGRGYHHRAGTPHAEVHALRQAGESARGATVYVTLEPCSHYGRTPPCAHALISAGVSKVVIAMQDPNPLVAGTGIKLLRNAGIEVIVGDMEQEARRLNEVFIKYITTQTPFVVFKTAMSLDGKIATSQGDSRWITGEPAREFVHTLRHQYDAIMVGINTVLTDDPQLTCRMPGGKDPVRLVVDSKLRLPLAAKVLSSSPSSSLIVGTTQLAAKAKITELERLGVQVLVYEGAQVPLPQFMLDLGQLGVTGILLEGGSTLGWSMLAQNLIDKVHFCIAPKLIGGTQSPGPIGGQGFASLQDCLQLQDLQVDKIGSDFIFTGYPFAN